MRYQRYTKEQTDWLIANVENSINSIELAEQFNRKFKTNRNPSSIRTKIKHTLPNHKWGWSGGREVGFGSSVTAREIGSERTTNGYLYIKINNKPISKNFTGKEIRENWVQKHRWLWEQANGEIPEGSMIIFLDRDRSNLDIANLYCINRKIHTIMIRNGWFTKDRELTLTAIKYAELHSLSREAEQ